MNSLPERRLLRKTLRSRGKKGMKLECNLNSNLMLEAGEEYTEAFNSSLKINMTEHSMKKSQLRKPLLL
jgi:broad-specificity NMP kinase